MDSFDASVIATLVIYLLCIPVLSYIYVKCGESSLKSVFEAHKTKFLGDYAFKCSWILLIIGITASLIYTIIQLNSNTKNTETDEEIALDKSKKKEFSIYSLVSAFVLAVLMVFISAYISTSYTMNTNFVYSSMFIISCLFIIIGGSNLLTSST
tara:strand:+ start:802 stop:1263 length:462 start_codon:yes stop_codon:yes gene_type:complete